MTRENGRVRVGTSGWSYNHWTGGFYPSGLKAKLRLAHYETQFDAVEINASFYRLPSEAAVAAWAEQAPPGFLFAWKASRYITQAKKLRDVGDSVQLVFGRMAPLGENLGPALFQLPPQLRLDLPRLEQFLALLPASPQTAIEFRHPSWYAAPVFSRLADFNVALCISDHHDAPSPWEVTASHVYVRGHGPGGQYAGRYPAAELDRWATKIGAWSRAGRQVYAFFDNDIGGAAPLDAAGLELRLAGESRWAKAFHTARLAHR
jgi:uncharacterized protein YecE (DUF72 family)